jgi:hypothetical protein
MGTKILLLRISRIAKRAMKSVFMRVIKGYKLYGADDSTGKTP